ncbi:hypothetical protein TNCV_410611 [Trichonephila clavipes]|nr:hypothetical protein TNCV_410611 [Trichonephila clavipes]
MEMSEILPPSAFTVRKLEGTTTDGIVCNLDDVKSDNVCKLVAFSYYRNGLDFYCVLFPKIDKIKRSMIQEWRTFDPTRKIPVCTTELVGKGEKKVM